MLAERKKPNIQMLNFRRQSELTLVAKQIQSRRSGKQETFYDLTNSAGFPAKYATPPCETQYAHLRTGGNFQRSDWSQTKKDSNIVTNILKEGDEDMFAEERKDFWEHMQGVCDSALQQMFDMDMGGGATEARKKATKYYKKRSPEEIEKKALENYKKNAKIPMKTKDGVDFISLRCKAFTYDGSEQLVRFMEEQDDGEGDDYEFIKDPPEVFSGSIITAVFSPRPYAMSKDNYGISFKLQPDIVVFDAGQPLGSSIPEEAINTPMRAYEFSTVQGKNGKMYVNTNDQEGRKLITRIHPTEVLFSDLKNGTLGKFTGVTPSTAKLTATLNEDPSDPESVAQFDYLQKLVNDGISYVLQDDTLMPKAKEDLRKAAKEMAEETGESFEDTYRTMVEDSFNNPITKRDEDEHRQLKITQRMFPYGEEERQNVIPLQDADGNNVTDTTEIVRGSKIAPVLSVAFYFMPDGGFGMKYEISLREGIRIVSSPEEQEGPKRVLYSFKRKSSAAANEEEPSSKRARAE